jgi:Flp pilus assembly pilin Flp
MRHSLKLWRDAKGISSVEYALLLAFLAGGVIFAASTLSNAVSDQIESAAQCFDGAPDANGGQGGGTGEGGGSGGGGGNGADTGDGFKIC